MNPKLEFPRGRGDKNQITLCERGMDIIFSRTINTAQHIPSCFQMMFWSEEETTQVLIRTRM